MKDRSVWSVNTSITKRQAGDSGMAVVLIFLLIGFFTGDDIYFKIAIPALIVNMIFPMFYYPFAIFWFWLSGILGAITSKILLSFIYLIIVMPVALIRQLSGKDTLLLKGFKKGSESVLKTRNQAYQASDLEKPF